jgi:hypothetical protein
VAGEAARDRAGRDEVRYVDRQVAYRDALHHRVRLRR